MIQIEASHIRAGGGKVLLVDLLNFLQERDLAATVWLTDNTLYKELQKMFSDKILIKKTTTIATLFRYCKKRTSVLFFCSLPPFVRCEKSVVYFHNLYNLWTPKKIIKSSSGWMKKIKHICYYFWIKWFRANVKINACQTKDVQGGLRKVYNINACLLPFFHLLDKKNTADTKYDFCYIAYPWEHKNFDKLLDAVSITSERKSFSIALTIPDTATTKRLIEKADGINKKFKRDIVFNLGLLKINEVVQLYAQSKALIFPSTLETFGLPLMEAYSMGLSILASDLNYVYDVIENPITFNPDDTKSIAEVMNHFLEGRYDEIKQSLKLENKIDILIEQLM